MREMARSRQDHGNASVCCHSFKCCNNLYPAGQKLNASALVFVDSSLTEVIKQLRIAATTKNTTVSFIIDKREF